MSVLHTPIWGLAGLLPRFDGLLPSILVNPGKLKVLDKWRLQLRHLGTKRKVFGCAAAARASTAAGERPGLSGLGRMVVAEEWLLLIASLSTMHFAKGTNRGAAG